MFKTTLLVDPRARASFASRRRLRSRNLLSKSAYYTAAGLIVVPFLDMVKASVRCGLVSARQIAIPATFIQGLMVLLAWSYFNVTAVQSGIGHLADFKASMGMAFSFVSMGSIAVFAESLKRLATKSKEEQSFALSAGFAFIVFGTLGVLTDLFYLAQNQLWSGLAPRAQIVAKVLTDQFVWTVLWANPYQTLLYTWKDCGFKSSVMATRIMPFRLFYVREMLAVLFMNWVFWIPVTAIIYSLPLNLQLPICQLAIVVWILLLMGMTRKEIE